MRIILSALAALAAFSILQSGRTEAGGTRPPRAAPPCVWPTDWAVLSPRGLGTSPAPLVVFVTPGWDGPVEVTVEAQGRRFVRVTPRRAFPWPESLPPLAPGETCGLRIAGAGGAVAAATYLRAVTLHEFPPSGTMPPALGR